jgi:hypothetical protein
VNVEGESGRVRFVPQDKKARLTTSESNTDSQDDQKLKSSDITDTPRGQIIRNAGNDDDVDQDTKSFGQYLSYEIPQWRETKTLVEDLRTSKHSGDEEINKDPNRDNRNSKDDHTGKHGKSEDEGVDGGEEDRLVDNGMTGTEDQDSGNEDGSNYFKKIGILKILNSKSNAGSKFTRTHETEKEEEFFEKGNGKFKNILKVVRADQIPDKKNNNSELSGSSSIKNVMSMDSFNILSKIMQNNKPKMPMHRNWLCAYSVNMIVLIIGLVFSNYLMTTFEEINLEYNSISDKSCNYTNYHTGFYYYLYDYYALKKNITEWSALQPLLPGFDLLETYKSKSMEWYYIGVNSTDDLLHTIYHSSIVDEIYVNMIFRDKITLEFFEYSGSAITKITKEEMH